MLPASASSGPCLLPASPASALFQRRVVVRGVGDAVVPAAITMVFTCIVRLIYLWGYAFSHNSNLTIAVIYPISWVLTSIAFLLYYKSRKWMPKGFHF